MILAITYNNGEIFQHFGHTEQFKLYEVKNHHVVKSKVVDTNGSGHGALATFLKDHGVDTLICGGIGSGAKGALAEAGIQLYGGVVGNADEKVAEFLNGTLNYNPEVACSHHEAHGEGRDCGSHKEHSCTHTCEK